MKSFRRILIRELVVLHALVVAADSLLAGIGLTQTSRRKSG